MGVAKEFNLPRGAAPRIAVADLGAKALRGVKRESGGFCVQARQAFAMGKRREAYEIFAPGRPMGAGSRKSPSKLRVRVATGVPEMGCAARTLIALKTKVDGSLRKEMFGRQLPAQMGAIAHVAGRASAWYFQQANATARAAQGITPSMGTRSRGTLLLGRRVAQTSQYQVIERRRRIEAMDAPPRTEAQLRTAECSAAA